METIDDTLKDIKQRLSAIENKLSMAKPSVSPQIEKVNVTPALATPEGYSNWPRSNPVEVASEPFSSKSVSTFNSSSMLGIIGIVFVILAGVFFIKITIDSGWLTPMRQVLLAAGTGLAFFLAPQFFPKAEKEYGSMLAGAGTTILHLTWLGAYFYHHILGATLALVCATLVGVFSVLANFEKGNRLYLLVAMAGTYFAAPLIGYSTGELSILFIFLIIWNISFSAAGLMNKRRDILFIASYYAVFTILLLSGTTTAAQNYSEILMLHLIQFVIFSSALVSYSIYHKQPLDSEESTAILPLLLLFYFSSDFLITKISPEFAPWYGIIIGGIVLGIYFFARSFLSGELKSGASLTAFSAMAFIHSFFFQLIDESWQPFFALLIGLAALVTWSQSPNARKTFFWPLIVFLATFVYGAILTVISTKGADNIFLYNWAYGIIALVAVLKLARSDNANSELVKYSSILLGFAHLEVMLGLYRFSETVTWSGALFVTFTWGLYAVIVLSLAYQRRDKVLGNSALTILLAVSFKAFFYDLSNTSNLIRVTCLLAEGLLLYGCGWIFKKMQAWSK